MEKEYTIAGNWKMNKTVGESVEFFKELDRKIISNEKIEILIFPPFTSLHPVNGISRKIKTGSQNIHFEDNGAFTGEISPLMLKNIVDYVLIGHSERREIFNEDDSLINKKIHTALKYGFKPVLCIGETLEERESGQTFTKISKQINKDLEGLVEEKIKKIIIAYEPIWAIGTGKTATPEQAQEVHHYIRNVLKEMVANPGEIPILYGGSVKPENSHELLSQIDINGVLVGGASLKIDPFFDIIKSSYQLIDK